MEPIIAGLLSNLAYDALKTGVKLPFQTTVDDRLEDAAESVAGEHSGLEAKDLLGLIESDAMAESVEAFEEGQPIPVEELVEQLEDHPVNKYVDEKAVDIIEEFLGAFEQELTAEPKLWRQILLQYVKAQRTSIEEVRVGQRIRFKTLQQAVEQLKTEVEELHSLAEPEELEAAIDGLQDEGFELLTSLDFENGPRDPENCWRRPFYFQEIREGYAIERELPPMDERSPEELAFDGGRVNVVEGLTADLRNGAQRVVLGNPGSGKSTLLKTVANRWDQRDDTGAILYRGYGESTSYAMDAADRFVDNVETVAEQDGPVLVIVEDAARDATLPLFHAIHQHLDDDRISYLLDSRETEWDDEWFNDQLRRSDEFDRDSTTGQHISNTFNEHIEPTRVPPLDIREVERIIDTFEKQSDQDVTATPEEIFDRIQSHRGVSSLLLLVYHLPVGGIQTNPANDRSILEQNVVEVFDAINYPEESDRTLVSGLSESEQSLLEQLGLAVVTLDLMEIGVHRELLLTLGTGRAPADRRLSGGPFGRTRVRTRGEPVLFPSRTLVVPLSPAPPQRTRSDCHAATGVRKLCQRPVLHCGGRCA